MYNHVQIISHGKVRIKSKYACVQLQHILINVQVMTVALAIIELCLSEGINQSVTPLNQSVENSVASC